jgi:hypothetical protein
MSNIKMESLSAMDSKQSQVDEMDTKRRREGKAASTLQLKSLSFDSKSSDAREPNMDFELDPTSIMIIENKSRQ